MKDKKRFFICQAFLLNPDTFRQINIFRGLFIRFTSHEMIDLYFLSKRMQEIVELIMERYIF
jgi:hypothetical protein